MRTVPVFRQPARQFAGGCGFSRTLQADNQEDARRFVRKAQLRFVAAEDLDQFLVDNPDNLLIRREGLQNFRAHGAGLHRFDQLFDDFKINVRLEQRHAHFAQSRIHIFGGETTFTAHVLKNTLQFVGEIIEHAEIRVPMRGT